MFKSQNKLVHAFCFKDRIPSKCTYGVVYKIQSGHFNELWYSEYVKHLNASIWEPIGISPLAKKRVRSKGSAVKRGTYLGFNAIKMLKKVSLALLTQVE